VHAAQRASRFVERHVGLCDARFEAVRGQLSHAERPREEAARVLALLQVYFERAFELRLYELQAAALAR
jgi:hypothetical protein